MEGFFVDPIYGGNRDVVSHSLMPAEVPRAELRFAELVADPDDLRRITGKLADKLCLDLEARGIAASGSISSSRASTTLRKPSGKDQPVVFSQGWPHRPTPSKIRYFSWSRTGIPSLSMTAAVTPHTATRQR